MDIPVRAASESQDGPEIAGERDGCSRRELSTADPYLNRILIADQTWEWPMQNYVAELSGIVPSPARYLAYQALVFDGVPLAGRSVLDVGGGNGVMSFYAASQGASAAVCLEPLQEGSNDAMNRQYQSFEQHVGGPVTRIHERFQDWETDQVHDVILVHNAINHFNEEACARIPAPDARIFYLDIFTRLRSLLAPGGHLILTDCARRNLWGDLHLPNIFAPTINWRIHQQPQVWDAFMIAVGFQPARIRWAAPSKLRRPGQRIFGNRIGSYLTNSHFIVTSQAGTEPQPLHKQ